MKLSILYSSYGDYQDLLPITYHFYNKYAKDFNLKVYWGSNGKEIEKFAKLAPNWHYIYAAEKDLGWSENLYTYLEQINSDYVLLLLDDFLFVDKPDIEHIIYGFEIMQKNDIPYFRLNNNPPPNRKIDDYFGFIDYFCDYRSSLQPAIWDKNILMKLCEYKFNPWLFEWKAGIVKETIDKDFLGSYKDLIKIKHCIEKGMWIEEMMSFIKKDNLEVSNRGIFKFQQPSKPSFKDKLLSKIDPKILFHLRKTFKKGIFNDKFKGASHK